MTPFEWALAVMIPAALVGVLLYYRREMADLKAAARLGRSPRLIEQDLDRYLQRLEADLDEMAELNRLLNYSHAIRVDSEIQNRLHVGDLFVSEFGFTETDSVGRPKGTEPGAARSLLDDLNRCSIPNLVILGDPGSGKTTLLRYVGGRLIELYRKRKSRRIPVFARLSEASEQLANSRDEDLLQCLFERARCLNDTGVALQEFAALVRDGRIVFLLDGLDEVGGVRERGHLRDALVEICRSEAGRENIFVVTSRKAGYEPTQIPKDNRWRYVELLGLTAPGVQALVAKLRTTLGVDEKSFASIRTTIDHALVGDYFPRRGNPLFVICVSILAVMGRVSRLENQYETFGAICSLLLETRFAPDDPIVVAALWTFLERVGPLSRDHRYVDGFPIAVLDAELDRVLLECHAGHLTRSDGDLSSVSGGPASLPVLPRSGWIDEIGILAKDGELYRFLYPTFRDYFVARSLLGEYPARDESPYAKKKAFWEKVNEEYAKNSDRQVLVFLAESSPSGLGRLVFDDFEELLELGHLDSRLSLPTFIALFEGSVLLREAVTRSIPERLRNFYKWSAGIQRNFKAFKEFLLEFLRKGADYSTSPEVVRGIEALRGELLSLASPRSSPEWDRTLSPTSPLPASPGVPLQFLAKDILAELGHAPGVLSSPEIVKISASNPRRSVKVTIAGENEGPLRAIKSMIGDRILKALMEKDAGMASRGWPDVELEVFEDRAFEPDKPLGGLEREIRNGQISLLLQPHRFLGALAHCGAIRPIEVQAGDKALFYNYDECCSYGLYDYGYPFSALSLYLCFQPNLVDPGDMPNWFDQMGRLRVPKTIEEYVDLCSALNHIAPFLSSDGDAKAKKQWYATSLALNPHHVSLWYEWLNFIYGAGGGVLDNRRGWEYGDVILQSNETVKGTVDYLSLFRYCPPECLSFTWTDMKQRFLDRQLFMCLIWTDQIHEVYTALGARAALDFFSLPGQRQISQMESWSFFIPSSSPHPSEALDFARWFATSVSAQTEYFRRGGAPSLVSFYDDVNINQLAGEFPYVMQSRAMLRRPGIQKETIPESDRITHAILTGFEHILVSDQFRTLEGKFSPEAHFVQNRELLRIVVAQEFRRVAGEIARITAGKAHAREASRTV